MKKSSVEIHIILTDDSRLKTSLLCHLLRTIVKTNIGSSVLKCVDVDEYGKDMANFFPVK